MKNIYKIALFPLIIGFTTGTFANTTDTDTLESESASQSITERKSCDDIANEIAELSAIEYPEPETLEELQALKQKQRSICNKKAGVRSGRSTTQMRSRAQKAHSKTKTPETTTTSAEKKDISQTTTSDKTCESPDENGCCPGEKYTDMGVLGFNCCPETGGDCFPPILLPEKNETNEVSVEPETEHQSEIIVDEATQLEQIAENIEAGLCADGTKPNKFGCCGNEEFKEIENLTFACCPPDGGDCFPPIK